MFGVGLSGTVAFLDACRAERLHRTGPGGGTAAYGFMVIGDFGTGDASEHAVAEQMRSWAANHSVHALITVGDNAYGGGDPLRLAEVWTEPFGWVEKTGIQLIGALGDNDLAFNDGRDVMSLLGMPHRWYKQRTGFVDIFVLDTNEGASGEQTEWLRGALVGSTAVWRIAVLHQPLYTCSGEGGRLALRGRWEPLFRRYGVNLVLSGNHHSYQRFAPLSGTTYVVTGGGGAPLHKVESKCPPATPQPIIWNDKKHHFLYLSVRRSELTGWAVSSDGETIDRFSIDRLDVTS
jgi:hypothetical protein